MNVNLFLHRKFVLLHHLITPSQYIYIYIYIVITVYLYLIRLIINTMRLELTKLECYRCSNLDNTRLNAHLNVPNSHTTGGPEKGGTFR